MLTLHQVLLNPEYSNLARGGPENNNAFSLTSNNVPQVNISSPNYVGKYTIEYEEMEEEERIALREFIILRRNNAYAFLFLAPDDFEDNQRGVFLKADRSVATVVEAGVLSYYMAKLYQDAATSYKRRITKPSPGANYEGDLGTIVYLNDNPVSLTPAPGLEDVPLYAQALYGQSLMEDTGISMDFAQGKLILTEAAAVAYAGQTLRWTGSFFIPAIFTSKFNEVAIDTSAVSSGKGINLMEVLPIGIGITI
jgi:hypothetical protein